MYYLEVKASHTRSVRKPPSSLQHYNESDARREPITRVSVHPKPTAAYRRAPGSTIDTPIAGASPNTFSLGNRERRVRNYDYAILSWPVMIKLTLVLVILSSGPTNTQERRRNGSRTTLANSYTCVSVQSTASRWRWGARAPRSSMC